MYKRKTTDGTYLAQTTSTPELARCALRLARGAASSIRGTANESTEAACASSRASSSASTRQLAEDLIELSLRLDLLLAQLADSLEVTCGKSLCSTSRVLIASAIFYICHIRLDLVTYHPSLGDDCIGTGSRRGERGGGQRGDKDRGFESHVC
ncbi:hypothetical protein ACN47E_000712 [Coniothyrium glycines]